MTGIQVLQMNELQTKKMLCDGASYKQIGEIFGVSKEVVAYFAKLNNLSRGSIKNNDEDVSRKIREKTNGQLEYVSGYTKKENPVKVRCVVCGGEFERTFHTLTTNRFVGCPYCIESKRNEIKQEQAREKQRRKEEREQRIQKRIEEEEQRRLMRVHSCPVCGEITNRNKYCSSECSRKADNKRRDFNRRMKLSMAKVDTDITVEGLYRRDKGICYLCGCQCNFEDYTILNGNFIAGDWYPSVDHVIPLAKGGKHSWGNVKLAHRVCNSRKSDNI